MDGYSGDFKRAVQVSATKYLPPIPQSLPPELLDNKYTRAYLQECHEKRLREHEEAMQGVMPRGPKSEVMVSGAMHCPHVAHIAESIPQAHTHTHTHTHTHSHTLSLSHTHSRTLSHSLTLFPALALLAL